MFVCPANGGFSNFTGNDRKLYHLRIALKTHVYHTSLISLIELLFAGKFKFDLSRVVDIRIYKWEEIHS